MLAATKILEAYAVIGVAKVKQALEQVSATGKTINSVKAEVTEKNDVSRLVIKARPFTSAIETGVSPTSKGVSKDMIDSLKEYARARGMDESAEWAIAKTIQKEGDKTFKRGGRDVYSSEVLKLADDIKKEIRKDYKIKFTSLIKNTFNGANSNNQA